MRLPLEQYELMLFAHNVLSLHRGTEKTTKETAESLERK